MPDNARKAAEMAELIREIKEASGLINSEFPTSPLFWNKRQCQLAIAALQASATRPAADPDGEAVLREALQPFARLADEVDALAAEWRCDPHGIARSCEYEWLAAARAALTSPGQSEAVRQIREHDIRGDEATMRGGHKCGWPDCGCDHDAVCFEALEAAREPLRVASTFSSRSGEMAAAALRKVEAALTSPARARGEG